MMSRRVQILHARRGATLTELLIAATMLVGLMGVFGPMSIQAGRMWMETRHHQLALDELSNQLDFILAVSADQRETLLENLSPSEAMSRLPGVVISAEEVHDLDGHRVVIHLNWERPGDSRPLSLAGWISGMPLEDNDA